MKFTFDTLPIEGKEILKQGILECFHRDISTVSCTFSSRNYVFIFGEGCFPAIIRVGAETPECGAQDVLSEIMWMDDLKNDVHNICQPIPSLGNRMVEKIAVGEVVYLVTMFRKANGATFPDTQWNAEHFYNAGALLGKIHRISSEGYQRGFRYKRRHWDESIFCDFSCFEGSFASDVQQDAQAVLQRIQSIPRDPRWYGMIHGDFHNGNLFYDWGELWAFDFDDCCYGYFMYDIACLAHIFIHGTNYAAAHPDMTSHDRILGENGILTHIRAGYTSEYSLPEEQWELFDEFFRLRVAEIACLHIYYDIYPKDIMLAIQEPMLAYLKRDKSPIDRIDEVWEVSATRMTPEIYQLIAQTFNYAG
ncbi:MAG: phosphotransferase [Lachnospiraceae bacterium]